LKKDEWHSGVDARGEFEARVEDVTAVPRRIGGDGIPPLGTNRTAEVIVQISALGQRVEESIELSGFRGSLDYFESLGEIRCG
jgi:hypothetical protein